MCVDPFCPLCIDTILNNKALKGLKSDMCGVMYVSILLSSCESELFIVDICKDDLVFCSHFSWFLSQTLNRNTKLIKMCSVDDKSITFV